MSDDDQAQMDEERYGLRLALDHAKKTWDQTCSHDWHLARVLQEYGFRRDQSETIARLQKERDAAIARADKEDAEATWMRKTLSYAARQLDKTGLNCGSAPLEEMARRVVQHLSVLEKERADALAEVARLRRALTKVAAFVHFHPEEKRQAPCPICIARLALAATDAPKKEGEA